VLDVDYHPNDPKAKDGDYNLVCCTENAWHDKKNKVLIVLETVDAQDLRAGRMLADRSRVVVQNIFNYAFDRIKWASQNVSKMNPKWVPTTKDIPYEKYTRKHTALSCVNFNQRKFFGESPEVQEVARVDALRRLNRIIDELQPTMVLVFGDDAARMLLAGRVLNHRKKRGWVFKMKSPRGHKYRMVPTLDLYDLYVPPNAQKMEQMRGADSDDDDGQDEKFKLSNLLFYVADHIQNALVRRLRFDLSEMTTKVVYVNSMSKFKELWARLEAAEVVGVDTETKNLSVNNNAVNTMQFSVDGKTGYVLPLRHPQSPFSASQLDIIESKLRKWFYARPGKYPLKYLIMQNGKYDLRVIRAEYGIPLIYHPVWEIMAGEFLLDENRSALKAFGTPHGGLDQIFQVYGNDHYERAKFGKEDRANSELTRLDNPDFLEYAATDTTSIFNIHLMQMERAAYLELGDKNYRPFFKRLVVTQMSNTVHVLSHMRQYGAAIDKEYLVLLKGRDSPLLSLIDTAERKLLKFPEVRETNRALLLENSKQAGHKGLFGIESMMFSFRKAEHRIKLFFETMGLEPLGLTKEKKPKVDKAFIAHYKADHPLVAEFGAVNKLKKLWSTYIKGWWNKLKKDIDGRQDWRLRADYGFFDVVTGRLNSFDPNLQQVPSHGAEADYIKRAFRSPKGTIHIKFDYSAHEVRCWSFVSRDMPLAETFRVGQKLRQKLRRSKTAQMVSEVIQSLKREGDLHILNVKFFFDKWVEKSDPLRDAVKKVIFGVIYGKSANTLARDVGKTPEFAKDLIARLYARFVKAGEWLQWSRRHAEEFGYTYSPIGFRRNLFGVLTGIQSAIASMSRKAANSPIQGLASQIGVTVALLIATAVLESALKFKLMTRKDPDLISQVLKAVHDANYTECPYRFVVPMIYIMQYEATYGVTNYYKKTFGVEFTIEPEIEIEIGVTEDKHSKWDWQNSSLVSILDKALQHQVELGDLDASGLEAARREIEAPLLDPEFREYLNSTYPILGQPDYGLELWTKLPKLKSKKE
jgi:DNA polymerase I-like protein with 3'-5' exonuclease and polymerase domains